MPKATPEAGKMAPNKDHTAIQIAALFDASAADQIVSDLKGKGTAAYMEKIDIRGKGVINKIYIGPFEDKKAAEVFLKKNRQIEKEYPDHILVKREFSKAKQQ